MTSNAYSTATHFSIVWGVALAIITLVEWNSLERNPVDQQIFSPFINRTIAVSIENAPAPAGDVAVSAQPGDGPDAALRYDVELTFNGPLFLACFFTPILIFHGTGWLWRRLKGD